MSNLQGKEEGESQDSVFPREKAQSAAGEFPEGGLTAWLTVSGGFMVLFCTFGAIQSFGVFQDYYTREFLSESTPSQISWIGSVQVFFLFAMGIFSGRIFDEGYFHQTILVGSLIYVLSIFMLSLTKPHNYYQVFLSQGIGIGVGMGLLFLPALSVASHHFRTRRSIAMGIISSGSSLGGILFPIFWNNLFHNGAGYKWGVRGAGFIILGLLLAANLMMRTRLPSRKQRRVDANVRPDIRSIVADISYLLCILGVGLVFWGVFFPFFYLQLFAVQHGVNERLAFYTITILNAASMFGRILTGILADRIGPLNVMISTSMASGILVFVMFKATTPESVIVFAILFGFFSGGVLSLSTPAVASFATSVNEVGVRLGIAMLLLSFFALTGTPIDGVLVRAPHYTWFRPIIFSGVVIFAGTAFMVLSRTMLAKRKDTWRV